MGAAPPPEDLTARLEDVYRDLHAHPELAFAEHRTAGIAADWLREHGFEVHEGIGGTGVAGVLRSGEGPVALLRADMDALPVREDTGLPYASTARAAGPEGETPVMHACGHDMHVACLLGAAAAVAADPASWRGTVVAVLQPAEEVARGAQAMVDGGLYHRVPRPDVVLGQHVAPLPAGLLGLRPGPAFAASDSLRITLHGSGGHGSRPEATVDPVVLAAATVLRLQTIVSREVPGGETAVVTVGSLRAGTAANVIPDRAELLVNIRTYRSTVRDSVLAAVRRIAAGEAHAAGSPRPPDIEHLESAPAVVNDADGTERTRPALVSVVGEGRVVDPGPVTGSEDVGVLAAAAGAPLVFWLLGGADPAPFAGVADPVRLREISAGIPSNHSPSYAPVIRPTLGLGVAALAAAARSWLPPS
jgi:hippurate hydrolase